MWKTLRIDMNTLGTSEEPFREEYRGLGGRGLVARVMLDEVDASCDPLGPDNKLLLATTALGGTGFSSADRLSVGCKSPLTGGIKEANAGGTVAAYMAGHGIRLIIIEGQPRTAGLWLVHVDAEGRAAVADARRLEGLNNYELVERLVAAYGPDVAVASIGSAGERGYANSSVQVTEFGTGHPCRAAARGGIGAVLGARRVKAVVLERPARRYVPVVADREAFRRARSELHKILAAAAADHPLHRIGTPDAVLMHAGEGVLPVRNFSGQKLEGIERLGGDRFLSIVKRRGKSGLPCQAGCLVRCSSTVRDEEGNLVTGGLEYETIALVGANCGITDYDAIARMDRLCDDLGVDTIETGATIALCMEAGRLPWGDGEGAVALLREMADGTAFGRLMGAGAEAVGRYLGVRRLPVAKHQAMPGYDLRGAAPTGVAFATCAMGADHTCAPSFGTFADTAPEEVCRISRTLQTMFAMADNLFCIFLWIFLSEHVDKLAALYAAVHGGPATPDRLLALGAQTVRMEREFNRAAGWTAADDVIPDFFYTEESAAAGAVFRIPHDVLRATLEGV